MRHENLNKIIRLVGVVLMITFISCLTGCGTDIHDPIDTSDLPVMPPAFTSEDPETPGKLVGVCYEYSAGSMNYHTEFAIDLNPEEVVHCEYWGSSNTDMVRKDNVPVTEEQWADVEKAVTGLMGVWEEIPEIAEGSSEEGADPEEDGESQSDEMFVLDGGDYSRWYLTWETDEGTKKIQYYNTSDRRIMTLRDLLYNLADGRHRKITWYEAPELATATYINDDTDMSFQCTWWDGENSGYRFIVRFTEDGEKTDIYEHVGDEVWEAARPAFAWIDPDKYPDGSYSDPVCLNFTYTDGSYRTIELDEKTVEIIEPYLKKLTLKYLEKRKAEQ